MLNPEKSSYKTDIMAFQSPQIKFICDRKVETPEGNSLLSNKFI